MTIPAPQFYTDPKTSIDLELLYSTHRLLKKGVTLKPGQGVLLLGTFLKQDAATKKYVKTNVAADVEGLLYQTTDTGATADARGVQGNILYGGTAKLKYVQSANSGVTLTSVLNAQVNTVQGFFKF